MRCVLPLCLGLALGIATAAQADDTQTAPAATTHAADMPQTLELGSVEVHGQRQVAQALLVIKQALKAPDSTDPAHRNDLVCRFVHELDNPGTYLDCATNAVNIERRNITQTARNQGYCTSRDCTSPADMKIQISSLVAAQPGQRLHMQVNPYAFKKMMAAAAAGAEAQAAVTAATKTAPAAATLSKP